MPPKTILNDCSSSYSEQLYSFGSALMETQRLCPVAHKVLNTFKDLNLKFKRKIFYHCPNIAHGKDNLLAHSRNTIGLETKAWGSSG